MEQSAKTGRRELYFQGKASSERTRWAPEQSVQNSVHEYGGGSFMPTPEGSVVYSTVEGLYEQKSPDGAPQQLANSVEKTFRSGEQFCQFQPAPSDLLTSL